MPTQKAIRNRLLAALYRQSGGDLSKLMGVRDVCEDLAVNEDVLEEVVPQLAEQGFITLAPMQYDPYFVFSMTMKGIEEVEKPWLTKMAQRYPFAYQCAWSLITLVVGAALLAAFGLKK